MENIKIFIATPCYGGLVYSSYTQSLLYTCMLLSSKNIKYEVKFINNQIVTRARNMLCSLFMADDSFTHMLFIDADVVWQPSNVLMLLEHNLECVIGVYPNKRYIKTNDDEIGLMPSSVFMKNDEKYENLLNVKYAAAGFMLLKKSALKRIEKDVQTFELPGASDEKVQLYNYFDCNVVDNDYLTEDYYFSYLFNKNGGNIYADKRIQLKHIGMHEYGELIKK